MHQNILVFYNDTTNNTGIIQDVEDILYGEFGRISGNTKLMQKFTAKANRVCDELTSIILEEDSRWQFDDSNATDLPIGTRSLVANQQDYAFDTAHIRVTRVEILGENGAWKELKPIDQTDIYDTSLTDFLKTAGMPAYYDKIGNSVFLYPKPSFSQAASLKVYFQRNMSYFTTGDTTKEPGVPAPYHRLVSLKMAYDQASMDGATQAAPLAGKIAVMEKALRDFIASRSKDEHVTISVRQGNFK